MSRSYRRPFAAITDLASAKWDKQMAHCGVRREQNLALKTCADYVDFLAPHRLECAWNNTYAWGRDGAQCYNSPWFESDDEFGLRYYRKLLRK
jgi:hypothetical protein